MVKSYNWMSLYLKVFHLENFEEALLPLDGEQKQEKEIKKKIRTKKVFKKIDC